MIVHPSPSSYNLRIDCGAVVTVNNAKHLLREHTILVSDGVIVEICPTADCMHIIAQETYHLPDHAVMPGLVNAHGHAAMSLLRGIANDLPLHEWLEKHIWPAEAQWVTEEFITDGTALAIAEMLKGGTTTFSDMYFYPEQAASKIDALGMRAQLTCPILDFPTSWGAGPDEYIAKTMSLHQLYADNDRIDIAFGPHAPYTVSDAPIEAIANAAKANGIKVQMHIHETQQEIADAQAQNGQRPLARLNKLGLLDHEIALQAVHMTQLTDEEVSLLNDTGTHVIHCPESNMKLASGFCPTQKLLDADVNVALGTDGAASNNDLDMFSELRTAALIAKGHTGDASAICADTAIRMATINGAKALGIEEKVGSIEIGKQADLIAIDLAHLNTRPSYDVIADLVYNTMASQVTHTWVAGDLLLDCGQLTKIDEHQLMQRATNWANKIKNEKP